LYDPIEIADLSIGYEEGNKKLTQHIIRERNQKNIKAAKFYHGYRCNICNFSFEEKYGVVGKEFIEAHHIIPLNEFDEAKEVNPKTDLITLCSNCHRMIHRNKNDALSIEELKKIIDEKKKNN
jgi:5-methylcytosine-specific restriction protein A